MISLTSPVETAAHRWPVGVKLGLLCGATVVLFAAEAVWLQVLCFAVMLGLYAIPGRPFFTTGLGRLRMLWPFVALIGVWHVVIGDITGGAVIVLRMITAVGLANLVTMTSKLSAMMALIAWLCAPLRFVGVRPDRVALAMALVVRFVPVLVGKGQLLILSWRARARKRPGWRIILPFAVLAIDDAEHVAEALRARGGI